MFARTRCKSLSTKNSFTLIDLRVFHILTNRLIYFIRSFSSRMNLVTRESSVTIFNRYRGRLHADTDTDTDIVLSVRSSLALDRVASLKRHTRVKRGI